MRWLLPCALLSACGAHSGDSVHRSARMAWMEPSATSDAHKKSAALDTFLTGELESVADSVEIHVVNESVRLSGQADSVVTYELAPILLSNLDWVQSVDASQLTGPDVNDDPFNPSLEQRLRDALALEFGTDVGFEVIVVQEHAVVHGAVPTLSDLHRLESAISAVDGVQRLSLQVGVLEQRFLAAR